MPPKSSAAERKHTHFTRSTMRVVDASGGRKRHVRGALVQKRMKERRDARRDERRDEQLQERIRKRLNLPARMPIEFVDRKFLQGLGRSTGVESKVSSPAISDASGVSSLAALASPVPRSTADLMPFRYTSSAGTIVDLMVHVRKTEVSLPNFRPPPMRMNTVSDVHLFH